MRFTMEVDMDNAAFVDDDEEIKRILTAVAAKVDEGFCASTILDSNGNRVGHWTIGPHS